MMGISNLLDVVRGRAKWWGPIDWRPGIQVSAVREQLIPGLVGAILVLGFGLGAAIVLAHFDQGDVGLRSMCSAIGGSVAIGIAIACLWSWPAGIVSLSLGGAIAAIGAAIAFSVPRHMDVGSFSLDAFVRSGGLTAGLGAGIVAGYRYVPRKHYAERVRRGRVALGAAVAAIAFVALVVFTYAVSQRLDPGQPAAAVNRVGLVLSAVFIILLVLFEPLGKDTTMVAWLGRSGIRLAPVAAATLIAASSIPLKPVLPQWINDAFDGALAGLIVAYLFYFVYLVLVALRMKPGGALLVAPWLAIGILLASRQLGAFEHLEKDWTSYLLGAVVGLLVGANVAMFAMRRIARPLNAE
jgi:hypothetical protein